MHDRVVETRRKEVNQNNTKRNSNNSREKKRSRCPCGNQHSMRQKEKDGSNGHAALDHAAPADAAPADAAPAVPGWITAAPADSTVPAGTAAAPAAGGWITGAAPTTATATAASASTATAGSASTGGAAAAAGNGESCRRPFHWLFSLLFLSPSRSLLSRLFSHRNR